MKYIYLFLFLLFFLIPGSKADAEWVRPLQDYNTIDGNLSVTGDIDVAGSGTITGLFFVSDKIYATDDVTAGDDLSAGDDLTAGGDLDVGGNAIIDGNIRANNYFSGDNSQGITDIASYEVCLGSVGGKCPGGWCVLQIKDGLITGCI